MTTPEQRKNNRRMGLTLASIAVMFFLGFLVRMIWFSGR
ncbi:cytochrome oxidase small assembly protein [Variovorax sp. CCNWLW225]|nr:MULTISPECIES: cytochrome oxidase small assembly protein [Variovorax]MCR8957035.1 cytochrome oxidase small assembly protein [Variovorax sp. S12S4]